LDDFDDLDDIEIDDADLKQYYKTETKVETNPLKSENINIKPTFQVSSIESMESNPIEKDKTPQFKVTEVESSKSMFDDTIKKPLIPVEPLIPVQKQRVGPLIPVGVQKQPKQRKTEEDEEEYQIHKNQSQIAYNNFKALSREELKEYDEQLDLPIDSTNVKRRKGYGNGPDLMYVDRPYLIKKANEIFGRGGWNYKILEGPQVVKSKNVDGKWYVTASCKSSVYIVQYDSFKEGIGSDVMIDSSENEAIAKALKAAETDAFKRAFVNWGNIFGLSLYDSNHSNYYQMNLKQTKK
jgi:hypothetical protein